MHPVIVSLWWYWALVVVNTAKQAAVYNKPDSTWLSRTKRVAPPDGTYLTNPPPGLQGSLYCNRANCTNICEITYEPLPQVTGTCMFVVRRYNVYADVHQRLKVSATCCCFNGTFPADLIQCFRKNAPRDFAPLPGAQRVAMCMLQHCGRFCQENAFMQRACDVTETPNMIAGSPHPIYYASADCICWNNPLPELKKDDIAIALGEFEGGDTSADKEYCPRVPRAHEMPYFMDVCALPDVISYTCMKPVAISSQKRDSSRKGRGQPKKQVEAELTKRKS